MQATTSAGGSLVNVNANRLPGAPPDAGQQYCTIKPRSIVYLSAMQFSPTSHVFNDGHNKSTKASYAKELPTQDVISVMP